MEEDIEEMQGMSEDIIAQFKVFLTLPHVDIPPMKHTRIEPLIDYKNSILLTQENHIQQLEAMALQKDAVAKEKKEAVREGSGQGPKREGQEAEDGMQKSKGRSSLKVGSCIENSGV